VQVTNFWDPSIVGTQVKGEIEQGKILIDAAKEAGVKFFVWRFVRPTSMTGTEFDLRAAASPMQPIYRRGSTLPCIILTVSLHASMLIARTMNEALCR
jgi:hypothetical protein